MPRPAILVRYLPALLLGVGIMLVWSTRSQNAMPLAGSLQSVLPSFADYRVTKQTISAEEQKIAGMSDYVARAYWQDSALTFTTYVGYYDRQTQGKSIHSPRNCLPGAGWEVLSSGTTVLNAGGRSHVVNKYMLKNGPYQAVVLYWYQGRGRVVANEYAVKWNLLRDAAVRGHTEEALVRIVAYVPFDSTAKSSSAAITARAIANAEKLAGEVGTRLLPDVERVLPAGRGEAIAAGERAISETSSR
jgi:EpsI family protein